MSESVRAMFDKLPIYWKMATFRGLLWAVAQMITTFVAGVQGYERWSEIGQMAKVILVVTVIGAGINSIMTFLDQTMTKLKPKDLPDEPATITTTIKTTAI